MLDGSYTRYWSENASLTPYRVFGSKKSPQRKSRRKANVLDSFEHRAAIAAARQAFPRRRSSAWRAICRTGRRSHAGGGADPAARRCSSPDWLAAAPAGGVQLGRLGGAGRGAARGLRAAGLVGAARRAARPASGRAGFRRRLGLRRGGLALPQPRTSAQISPGSVCSGARPGCRPPRHSAAPPHRPAGLADPAPRPGTAAAGKAAAKRGPAPSGPGRARVGCGHDHPPQTGLLDWKAGLCQGWPGRRKPFRSMPAAGCRTNRR